MARCGVMARCEDCVHNNVCKYVNEKVSVGILVFETLHNCKDYLSAADVAEVVRCKNCAKKVDYKGRIMCSKNARVICGELCGLTATSDEHFCSYGERRKNLETEEN